MIEPHGKLVKLTLTHEGFAEGSKFLQGISQGWPAILSGLKSLLETGKPLDVPYAAMKSGAEAAMKLDNFKPTTVYTIYIASTPEKVWEALTSAELSRQYFFGNAVEVELKVGGAFIVRAPDGSLHIGGEVFECDPPRKLTVTFNVNWPALIEKLGPTLVTYEIEPAGRRRPADHDRVA